MRLENLLQSLEEYRTFGSLNQEIVGLCYDSRRAQPGYLFVCVSGYPADRHLFIEDAKNRGAIGAVVEKSEFLPAAPPKDFTYILVPDTAKALAQLSVSFYGDPSRHLRLYGVTGTNGKTTCTFLLESLFQRSGQRTGLIGTIECHIAGEIRITDRTTPESLDLQSLLAEMRDKGVEVVAMEVSSHALKLGRVWGCRFDGALFTNLTQDHLDFHPSLEDYYQSKRLLFTLYREMSGKNFVSAIYADDPFGQRLISEIDPRGVITFGFLPSAEVRAEEVVLTPQGSSFRLISPWGECEVTLHLIGSFNIVNAMGVSALALASGYPLEVVQEGLSRLRGVPGRFERIDLGQPFTVVVDYAHTPDGLEKVLVTARELTHRRLICVFGCGGNRDPSKRPKMGRIASELADVVYVTSDNPRKEDPQRIIDHILEGIPPYAKARIEVLVDRRQAIFQAIREAQEGDLVLIAGKGHETYQILGEEKIPFDDREVAREAIRDLLYIS